MRDKHIIGLLKGGDVVTQDNDFKFISVEADADEIVIAAPFWIKACIFSRYPLQKAERFLPVKPPKGQKKYGRPPVFK